MNNKSNENPYGYNSLVPSLIKYPPSNLEQYDLLHCGSCTYLDDHDKKSICCHKKGNRAHCPLYQCPAGCVDNEGGDCVPKDPKPLSSEQADLLHCGSCTYLDDHDQQSICCHKKGNRAHCPLYQCPAGCVDNEGGDCVPKDPKPHPSPTPTPSPQPSPPPHPSPSPSKPVVPIPHKWNSKIALEFYYHLLTLFDDKVPANVKKCILNNLISRGSYKPVQVLDIVRRGLDNKDDAEITALLEHCDTAKGLDDPGMPQLGLQDSSPHPSPSPSSPKSKNPIFIILIVIFALGFLASMGWLFWDQIKESKKKSGRK